MYCCGIFFFLCSVKALKYPPLSEEDKSVFPVLSMHVQILENNPKHI